MEWGDPKEALRAEVELAKRQSEKVRARARAEQERSENLRAPEREAVEAAKARVRSSEGSLRCRRCNAVWRADAVAESMRREPLCLLCGGPLTAVP